MYPTLVEPTIKYILQSELKTSRDIKFNRNSFFYNIICFVVIISVIGFILWLQYNGKKDLVKVIEKENKKRDYILSKIQIYQKIKTREYTNIPM
jgi:hypothetical protein